MAAAASPTRFYGWRIVGVAFVSDFVATGFLFYSYGVFFKALAQEFGGSRLGISVGIMLVNLVAGAAAPFVGRAVDRYPIRRIMVAGAFCVAAGYALLSRVAALWQLYLVLATLVALGNLAMANITSHTLVGNWFVARRGTALGIATMGISLSGLVMPPLATWLVASAGWRGGFVAYALATLLLVVPLAARVVVNRPEDLGVQPDGAPPPPPGAAPALASERPWRSGEILREPNFWAVAIPFALSFSAVSGILTHVVPHVTDLGVDPYRAASILSVCAACGVAGKFVFGWLVDRLDARVAVWSAFGAQLAGTLLLMEGTSYGWLAAGAAIFGFGMGGIVPLQATLVGNAFGRLAYGRALGLMRPFQVPIHALGVPFAGLVFDLSGSYDWAFRAYLLAVAAAAAGVFRLRLGGARARR